jgi:tRNA nucleotidyltransferase/poly(A) polymerase
MTEEVSSAITNDQVQQMLKHKISRERVYKEFSLMIKGVNHMQSLRYLHQFNLLQIVFKVPEDFPNLLEKGAELMFKISRPKSDSNLILYSSALLVFYSLDGDFKVKRKKRDVEVSELVCEELKMTNQEIASISNIVSTCKQMIQVLQNFDILLLAELLRKLKENWRLSLIIAAHVSSESPLNSIQELEAFVEFHRLGALWLEKPLINVSHIQGDEIKKLLNVEGKSVGNYIQACLNWQVLHREATRDDLIAYLKTYKPY